MHPEPKIGHAGCVTMNYAQLYTSRNNFDRSLQLLSILEADNRPWELQIIPLRDGAMQIFHFYNSLKFMRANFNQCRYLIDQDHHRTLVNLLSNAFDNFEAEFPNCRIIRNAIAHEGERYKNTDEFERHFHTTDQRIPSAFSAAGVMTLESRAGRTYINSFKGILCSVDITPEKLAILDSILITADAVAVEVQRGQGLNVTTRWAEPTPPRAP